MAAMNEMLETRCAKQVVNDSIAAVLAGKEQELSLPSIESQIKSLQERQMELYQLAVAGGPDCLDYDEELQQVNMAKTQLVAKKAELIREGRTAAEFDRHMEQIGTALEESSATVSTFDDVTIRQLISCIKVLDKTHILVRFKDGTEIEQEVIRE